MKKILLSAAGVLLCAIRLFSQAGSVDLTFNTTDIGYNSGLGPDYHVYCSAIQPDGKIIIGGDFYQYNAFTSPFLTRLNQDGTFDPSFNIGSGLDGSVYSVVVQPDGKILIGGDFYTVNGIERSDIARLNQDGSVDLSFDPGTGFDGYVKSLALRPNGRVLVGGYFYNFNGYSFNNLVQLFPDGTADFSMEMGIGPDSEVSTIHLNADGSFFIGGFFNYVSGLYTPYLAKLMADGALDSGFITGYGPDGFVNVIKVRPDGKILIGGSFYNINGTYTPGLGRLFPDGSVDTDFTTGQGLWYEPKDLLLLNDGSILVGGDCNEYNGEFVNRIFKLTEDGILDPGFSFSGNVGVVNVLLLQPDGNVIVGSEWDYYLYGFQQSLFRIDQAGNKDGTFNAQTGADSHIHLMEITPDGKIMIGGDFTMFNGTEAIRVGRLNEDGSLDSTFDFDFVYYLNDMKVQPDGKVLLAGNIEGWHLVRLDESGNLDSEFLNSAVYDGEIYLIRLLSDGKILITGSFYSIDGVITPGIARLNSDGTLDTSFNVTSGIVGGVNSILVEPDGKILLAGYFYEYNGTPVQQFAFRLNSDGSLDTGFAFDISPYVSVYSPVIDLEGRYLIGAQIYDGICCYTSDLIRLLPNGSIDSSFNSVSAPYLINNITVQPDGKILYTEYGDENSGPYPTALKRLLPDGDPDPSFDIGSGPSHEISRMIPDAQGRLMVCGGFHHINGIGRNKIARLHGDANICAQVDFLCRVGGQPIGNMKVELFKVTGTNIELQGAQSFTDAAGHTAYVDIAEGQYICRAIPNPGISGQENLLSTFTNETYTWQQADILEVSCGMALLDTIDIIMLPAPGTFPGNASGTVRYMTDPPGLPVVNDWLAARSFVTGDPIPGVPCVIERDTTSAAEPSGNYFPFQLSVTNVGGEYGFVNLPTGHYKIHVDMPGLPMAETHLFQVTAPEPAFSELNFYVDPNDAIYIHDVISVEEAISHTGWVAYPNPFRNALTLVADGPINGVSYELLSFEGKTVITGRLNGSIGQIETSDLSRGIYFLRLNSNGEMALFKVIKE